MIMWNEIPINRKEISQELLDIETKTRTNGYTWNGQFSPQLVETLLNYHAKQESYVLDPFSGSGTVLLECGQKNISACGVEINPAAYLMSKSYEYINCDEETRSMLLDRVNLSLKQWDAIGYSIDPLTVKKIFWDEKQDERVSHILQLVLILLNKEIASLSIHKVQNIWSSLQTKILHLPYSNNCISARNIDARELGLVDASFNIVITSPPYINVFNYHQQYRNSVEALGYESLKIAKSELGSNRKHRSNRFLTVGQYYLDIALTIKAILSTIVDKGKLVFIIGRESSVQGVSFSNSKIIFDIFDKVFCCDFVMRQERKFTNKYGVKIYEDILTFEKPYQYVVPNESAILASARILAMKDFEEHLTNGLSQKKNADVLDQLTKAVGKVHSIEPSPLMKQNRIR